MRKILVIFTLIIIGANHASAQSEEGRFHIYLGSYYNSFSQGDLRDLQSNFNRFPNGSQKTAEFPNFISFDAGVLVDVGALHVGAFAGYQSTGARNFYSDFSGYLKTDFIVEAYSFGASGKYRVDNTSVWVLANLGVAFNKVKIEQELGVFEERGNFFGNYTSRNLVLQLGLKYQILRKNPTIGLIVLVDIGEPGTELSLSDKSPDWIDDATIPFKVNWTGFKVGLQIGCNIF